MRKAAKAIFAGVYFLLGSISIVLVGDVTFGDVTDGQWVAAILAGLGAAGGVYGIRNSNGG